MRAHSITLMDFRLACFLCALGVYALAGSPTPDHPGIIELIVAGLLVCAAGFYAGLRALRFDAEALVWRGAGTLLLLYGIVCGLSAGVLRGNEAGLMLRDAIPFLFLLLPLFLEPLTGAAEKNFRAVLAGVLVPGVVFGLRASAGDFLPSGEPTYLANMPSVLFVGLFIAGWGAEKFIREFNLRAFFIFVLCGVCAGAAFLPLILTTQRASIGYAALYFAILGAAGFWRYPHRMVAMLALGVTGLILTGFFLLALLHALLKGLRRDLVLGLALLGPFLIDVFLYASYKSLDFGLILLLIASMASMRREVA